MTNQRLRQILPWTRLLYSKKNIHYTHELNWQILTYNSIILLGKFMVEERRQISKFSWIKCGIEVSIWQRVNVLQVLLQSPRERSPLYLRQNYVDSTLKNTKKSRKYTKFQKKFYVCRNDGKKYTGTQINK